MPDRSSFGRSFRRKFGMTPGGARPRAPARTRSLRRPRTICLRREASANFFRNSSDRFDKPFAATGRWKRLCFRRGSGQRRGAIWDFWPIAGTPYQLAVPVAAGILQASALVMRKNA